MIGNNLQFAALPTLVWGPIADVSGKSKFVFSSFDERPPTKREDMFQLPWWLY